MISKKILGYLFTLLTFALLFLVIYNIAVTTKVVDASVFAQGIYSQ